ncbi:hypothetical protein GJU39_04130 [Pedobacter petrophilus]|uniref:Uncharacterized protein n=1 Tax=Pedobacter petrophilus TaxID=1908241 RepID=A0A7K0FUK5_9SPHI|nr:DUF2683 family protein [Pedobacter petrophilus]MRX75268.1 hypothetical protein [Pedobacter petrophilus]
METLIAHPKNEEEAIALKAVMKVLKIDFETENSPYNREFVEKILSSEKARKSEKPGLKINVQDMWK